MSALSRGLISRLHRILSTNSRTPPTATTKFYLLRCCSADAQSMGPPRLRTINKAGSFKQKPEDALLPVGTCDWSFDILFLVNLLMSLESLWVKGGMKRHGLKRGPSSHGAILITSKHWFSTGQRDAPGKVFKGKKMPGRMGWKIRERLKMFLVLQNRSCKET
ncbi:hypothetical protein NC653_022013 [Populus alba x Populus x berolinensis]|uniref:Uncharacterized protein n=1 Tax=Populus alba x Populus x berolinensis TaxID=444605 RepID=A0AAD6QFB2_9ROSI|nr:hypothetical protein NC653_022013 [Populus alba x Populus x berolinensis]